MKKTVILTISVLVLSLMMVLMSGCGESSEQTESQQTQQQSQADTVADIQEENTDAEGEYELILSDSDITLDGASVGESGNAVYLSNDIIYYEDRDTYDSGNAYGEGEQADRHSAEDAAANTVVNIARAGTYRISGTLSRGQIRVDLGEEAKSDRDAVVTLVLDGVDISCDVAPAILFLNVYECDGEWSAETAGWQVDTAAAGANIIIADGSENNISGSHVARIYKDTGEEKKLWKQDGAVYSYMSMNVDAGLQGTGVMNITADNEGMDTELHLTVNGGNINIRSQNDGINTNEDGVSVTTINGGNLHIIAGLGAEGDGVDSNGWLVINGGTVVTSANPAADAGLDSDMGSYVNGGIVIALGSTMDWAESESEQVTMNLQFAENKNSGDAVVVTELDGKVIFAYDPSEDEIVGSNARSYMGAVISCAEFEVGESYNVYIGGQLSGTETGGVYTEVSEHTCGIMQAYTGTDVTMGMGGGFGGMRPENGMEIPQGEVPEIPEGMERPDMQQRPQGEFNGERPEMPDEMKMPPEDGFDGHIPGMGGAIQDRANENTVFYMQDKVNAFSGLSNVTE